MYHPTTYDTLLSHNSQDKRAVEQLAVRLRAEGVSVWFDKWNLVPGELWQDAIERALANCSSMAVFFGPDDLGGIPHVGRCGGLAAVAGRDPRRSAGLRAGSQRIVAGRRRLDSSFG